MNCRHCNTTLKDLFVDLFNSPPSNSFLKREQLNTVENYFPLKTYICNNCFLVQIAEYKRASEIFNNEYVYFSSFSRSWLDHAEKYTQLMIDEYKINSSSFVVEIASNDGYLLQYFKEKKIQVLGIEPTLNTAEVARKKGIDSINDFFGKELATTEFFEKNRLADLIIGNNVLAHVPDINDFVEGLKIALKPKGIITFEFPHLESLIEYNQFDTIYHEHFSYLSFTTVNRIFNYFGLQIFRVDQLKTHGGSLRIYATHQENKSRIIDFSVHNLLAHEENIGMSTLKYYEGFQQKVLKVKLDFLKFLIMEKEMGKTVIGYGAAAKGNTLLNYCGVKSDLIPYCLDASVYKQGLFMPGSHIPVVSPEEIRMIKPDYVIIFPWNLKDEIQRQYKFIEDWGGKFVVPIPELKVY